MKWIFDFFSSFHQLHYNHTFSTHKYLIKLTTLYDITHRRVVQVLVDYTSHFDDKDRPFGVHVGSTVLHGLGNAHKLKEGTAPASFLVDVSPTRTLNFLQEYFSAKL